MKNEIADRLYKICEEVLEGKGDASELYNIVEGHVLNYIEEQEN